MLEPVWKRLRNSYPVHELIHLRQGFGGQGELGIITTLGEEGVKYEEEVHKVRKVFKVKSLKVKKVVDPTGAGDAWRGGFISGLALGMEIIDCLKLGNVMASFAIEKYGTVNHKPTEKEIKERVKTLDTEIFCRNWGPYPRSAKNLISSLFKKVCNLLFVIYN